MYMACFFDWHGYFDLNMLFWFINFEFYAFCDNIFYVLADKMLRKNNKINSLVSCCLAGKGYGVCVEDP
jgi:hypothetical protein